MMNKVKTKIGAFATSHPTAFYSLCTLGMILLLVGVCVAYLGIFDLVAAKNVEDDLRSPQYEAQGLPEDIDFMPDDAVYHTSEEGVVVIPAATTEIGDNEVPRAQLLDTDDTDKIWEADKVVSFNSFTTQERVKQADGSIGVLSIPKLSLNVNIFTSENELESMTKGLGHFAHSSSWDGNVAVCGHNINYDLTDGYFKNLHMLQAGDEVVFTTTLGERKYQVSSVSEIKEDDWSGTARSSTNKITMITCISGKPNMRLMVVATQV